MFGGKTKSVHTEHIETIIGQGTLFKGKVEATGTIRIDGRFEGEVLSSGDLIIGESGVVTAQIQAKSLTIAGTLQGNATVQEKLELLPTGKLYGDIAANVLSIGEGAVFKGACAMSNNYSSEPVLE
ncbi:MAG: polymer-forming cytoskeletal protein [Sporomusaceae bacterium]|nr:polymer-forming cytoskeletal protein [Sporomusaceae bacterium]